MRLLPSTTAWVRRMLAVVIASLAASAAHAQVPTSGNVFFGYSYMNTTPIAFTGTTSRQGLNGWEGSLEGKVFPHVALVADIGGNYGSETLPIAVGTCAIGAVCQPIRTNTHIETFLFGPRVSASFGKSAPSANSCLAPDISALI